MTKLFNDVHTAIMSDKQISENILVKNLFENFAVKYPSISESNIEKAMTDLSEGLSGVNTYLKNETLNTQVVAITEAKSKLGTLMPGATIAKMYSEFNLVSELESMKESKAYSNPAMKTFVDGLLYNMKFKNLPSFVYLPNYLNAMEAFSYDTHVKESVDRINKYIANNRKKLIMLETVYKLDMIASNHYKALTENLKRLLVEGEYRSSNIKTKLGQVTETMPMVREMLANLKAIEAANVANTFSLIEGNNNNVKVYEYFGPALRTEDSIITLVGNSFVEITEAGDEYFQFGEEPEENELTLENPLELGDEAQPLPGTGDPIITLINQPEEGESQEQEDQPLADLGVETEGDDKMINIKICIPVPESKYNKRLAPINGYALGFLKTAYVKENHPAFFEFIKNYTGMGFTRNDSGVTAKLNKITIDFKTDEAGDIRAYFNGNKITDLSSINIDEAFVIEGIDMKKRALNVFQNLGNIFMVDFLKTFVSEGKTASVINLEGKYIVYSQIEENKSNLYAFNDIQLYTFIKESFKYDMRHVFNVSISEAETKWKTIDAKKSSILEQIQDGENALGLLDKTVNEFSGDQESQDKFTALREKITSKISELKNSLILTENEMAVLEDDGTQTADIKLGSPVVGHDGKEGIKASNDDGGTTHVLDKGANTLSAQKTEDVKPVGAEGDVKIDNNTTAPEANVNQIGDQGDLNQNSNGKEGVQATNNPSGAAGAMPESKSQHIDEVETPYLVLDDPKQAKDAREKHLKYLRNIVKQHDAHVKPSELDNDIKNVEKLDSNDGQTLIEVGQLFKKDLDAVRDSNDGDLTDEFLGDAYHTISAFMKKFGASESLVNEAVATKKPEAKKDGKDKDVKPGKAEDKKPAKKEDKPDDKKSAKKEDIDFKEAKPTKAGPPQEEEISISKKEHANMTAELEKLRAELGQKVEAEAEKKKNEVVSLVDVIKRFTNKSVSQDKKEKLQTTISLADIKKYPQLEKLYTLLETAYINSEPKVSGDTNISKARQELTPLIKDMGLEKMSDFLKDRTVKLGSYLLQFTAVMAVDEKLAAVAMKPILEAMAKEIPSVAKMGMELSIVNKYINELAQTALTHGVTGNNLLNMFRKESSVKIGESLLSELYSMNFINEAETEGANTDNEFIQFLQKIGAGLSSMAGKAWGHVRRMIDSARKLVMHHKAILDQTKETDSLMNNFIGGNGVDRIEAAAETAGQIIPSETPAATEAPKSEEAPKAEEPPKE